MQHVVDTDDIVRSRLGEFCALFDKTERVKNCRGQRNREVQLASGSGKREETFKKLAKKASAVFIVRLRQERLVDHAVVLDANRGIIAASEKRLPLVLLQDVLMRCVVLKRTA